MSEPTTSWRALTFSETPPYDFVKEELHGKAIEGLPTTLQDALIRRRDYKAVEPQVSYFDDCLREYLEVAYKANTGAPYGAVEELKTKRDKFRLSAAELTVMIASDDDLYRRYRKEFVEGSSSKEHDVFTYPISDPTRRPRAWRYELPPTKIPPLPEVGKSLLNTQLFQEKLEWFETNLSGTIYAIQSHARDHYAAAVSGKPVIIGPLDPHSPRNGELRGRRGLRKPKVVDITSGQTGAPHR